MLPILKIEMLIAASIISILATPTSAFMFPTQKTTTTDNKPTPFRKLPFQPRQNPLSTTSLVALIDDTDDDGKITLSVALTREAGKNQKLKEQIANHPSSLLLADTLTLDLIEMPCVQHAEGPDVASFLDMVGGTSPCQVLTEKFDYIVITSSESAKVFAGLVASAESFAALPAIAAVGKATKQTLLDLGFTVSFTPSKANGETMTTELPPIDNNKVKLNRVLYPASAQADDTIQDLLEGRKDCSFTVTRFNTYDTVPVVFDEGGRGVMNGVDLALFGSPSAVRAWLGNVDLALGVSEQDGSLEKRMKEEANCNGNVMAICIGGTTAKACLESKRWVSDDIYYPSTNPGIKGWVESCLIAAGDVMEKAFWC